MKRREKRFQRLKVIGVRVTLPEYLSLHDTCKRLGITPSTYIRSKMIFKGPDTMAETISTLRKLLSDLTGKDLRVGM